MRRIGQTVARNISQCIIEYDDMSEAERNYILIRQKALAIVKEYGWEMQGGNIYGRKSIS